jgi:hypothetical protein
MAFLAQAAVDASVAQDAGRGVIPWTRREAVHDCQWASDLDFPTAMAVTERLFLLARQGGVRERNPALKPQDALQRAAHHLVQLAGSVSQA